MIYVLCVGVPVAVAALLLIGVTWHGNRRDDRTDEREAADYVMRLKYGTLWRNTIMHTQLIHLGSFLHAFRQFTEVREALDLIGTLTSPAAPASILPGAGAPAGTAAAAVAPDATPPASPPPPLPDWDAAYAANAKAAELARAETAVMASFYTPLDGAL